VKQDIGEGDGGGRHECRPIAQQRAKLSRPAGSRV
jgi:hypothetical protein